MVSIVEAEMYAIGHQKAVQVLTPQAPFPVRHHFGDRSGDFVELPAKESSSRVSPMRRIVGIVEKVLFHAHEGVPQWLLFDIFLPGLLRSNLEDHVGGRSRFPDLPTSEMAVVNPFDHGDIRS